VTSPSATAAPPRVSILLSVHNAESTVGASVASLLAQTWTDFELLLVDDASTDGTAAVLDTFTDPRIRRLRLPVNLGLTAALNEGLRMARGKYLARLDADDVATPDRLARQVAFLDAHPEIGVLGSSYEMRPPGCDPVPFRNPSEQTHLRFAMLFDNAIAHPTVLMRRSLLANGYDPAFPCAQEYALWAALWDCCGLLNLPETLVIYGHAPSRISVSRRPEQERLAAQVSLSLMRRLLPGRALERGHRDEAALAWPACPIPATPASLRGAELVLALFAAFRRGPFVDRRTAGRMRRAWLLRVLNSIRVDQLGLARRTGFLGAAFWSHPFTLLWYAGLRAIWILLGRLGFNWKYKHS
jgi:glycosyltransferase involved in cell wall biosynthesis